MALTDYQTYYNTSYQETFLKRTVSFDTIATKRFEKNLVHGGKVTRTAYDVTGVLVRPTIRGSASTIDQVNDSTEDLIVNIEEEANFTIADGERTQAYPEALTRIGSDIGRLLSINLDAKVFAEVKNALFSFDAGDLTTAQSNGTPVTLNATTVPQLTTRVSAKLKNRNYIDTDTNMVWVVDSYAASDVEQFLISKNIDLAGSVFSNGYKGTMSNGTKVYTSENLTGEAVLTPASNFTNGQTVIIKGVTFTAVSTIGTTAGNFLIGASIAATLTNLAGLLNNPFVTNANQVAITPANLSTIGVTMVAVATSTNITITSAGSGRLFIAGTATPNIVSYIYSYYGKKGGVDLVIQDMKEGDFRKASDRRATNVFSSYLAGVKTYADGAKKFLAVKIAV